jgi:hypothetical protein
MHLNTTPAKLVSAWLAVAKETPKPALTRAKTLCLLAGCAWNRAFSPRNAA